MTMRKLIVYMMVLGLLLGGCAKPDPKPDDTQPTIEEKVAQMIQAERYSLTQSDQENYQLGSVLSGGGSVPSSNTPQGWIDLIASYQEVSDIPVIYGVDAVHGHNNANGATIFPHNIALGATNDPELIKKIGIAVGKELLATGVHWNFAPCLAVVQDIRWGRTYESYSENPQLVSDLGTAFIQGIQSTGIAATAKHYLADGGTIFGTSGGSYKIDQGDAQLDEETLRTIHLYPYLSAIAQGNVLSVMISFSSINGLKMHANDYWINDVLKDELNFKGLVVSDWEAIHQLEGSLYMQLVSAVNAGVDLLMEPNNWKNVYTTMLRAVKNGDIAEERIDDAFSRIQYVKEQLGLIDETFPQGKASDFNAEEHRALAREAVSKSLVLLKNNNVLPLSKSSNILLIGPGADNAGLASGGWTVSWQGEMNDSKLPQATTLKEAFESVANENGATIFSDVAQVDQADVVVVVLSETPYAEGVGDASDLGLSGNTMHPDNMAAIEFARTSKKPVVVLLNSGRPRVVGDEIDDWDALVMTWLYGSEAQGITDVLYGDLDFTGKLPVTWPKTSDTSNTSSMAGDRDMDNVLFDFGYGLHY